MKLSKNALIVLRKKYLKKIGKKYESPESMFRRIARNIAKNKEEVKEFYNIMANLEFLPNTPAIRNAGRELQQLAACFVLPINDSIEEIFQSVKDMALIQKTGGGSGFSFSRLRPEGSKVGETGGIASGPVSFMKVFDAATAAIKEGGTRRGANMGILRVDHPDIIKFITAKKDPKELTNFNISVALTNKFMQAVLKNKKYPLINPQNKKTVAKLPAKKVFDLLCHMSWLNGEPGVIFIDRVNKFNPIRGTKIEATNPCSEMPLLPYESCVLGSISLTKFIKNKSIDYQKLKQVIKIAVNFLDNMINKNKYPIKEIEKQTKLNRKIGLGIMGWADLLIQLNIPYDSNQAIQLAEKLMKFITEEARKASAELGKTRGSFPNIKKSIYKTPMRNATVTTIAPTGTLNFIANISSGIEPVFSKIFYHDVMEHTRLYEKRKGKFKTAYEISPEWHVKVQAAFQKYTDNAISKTVNLKHSATPEDVKKIYLLAYKLGSKSIAVYREKSRPAQVLNICKTCR
jgi:ribonucleoside-diphosphate reductase alpha chain